MITNNGRPAAVRVSPKKFEGRKETNPILSDPAGSGRHPGLPPPSTGPKTPGRTNEATLYLQLEPFFSGPVFIMENFASKLKRMHLKGQKQAEGFMGAASRSGEGQTNMN